MPDILTTTRALSDVAASGGELWLVLWQSLKDVWLWGSVSGEEPGALFGKPAPTATDQMHRARLKAPELKEALNVFHLVRTAGTLASGPQVAKACQDVSGWAEGHSLVELAAYFAEAAAVADPENPSRANNAARFCRKAALAVRASMWYERAYTLAIRARTRREMVWALLGHGDLNMDLGHYDRARRRFEKVAHFAMWSGRPRIAAEAHHSLIGLCALAGDIAQADEHAQLADYYYSRSNPLVLWFVLDFAILMVKSSRYETAMIVVRSLPSLFSQPELQMLAWSTVARAAAGIGQVETHRKAEQNVLGLCLYEEYAAAALINLAEGARMLRDATRAATFARLALDIAKRRMEDGIARTASDLIDQIERNEPVPPWVPAREDITVLAHRLAARVDEWKARSSRVQRDYAGRDDSPA